MQNFKQFEGTRGNDGIKHEQVLFSDAILDPSTSFGGLYVPGIIPKIDSIFLEKLSKCSYKDLAFYILKEFGVDLGSNDIYNALARYDNFDDPTNPVPVVEVGKNTFVSELWHGQTRAFKDMALQPFPIILSTFAIQMDKKYLVLVATSGDTGPAALDGFKNLKNVKVVCFYPKGGTSQVQENQMIKVNGENLKVVAIRGNFDDAQSALKEMIASDEFKKQLQEKGYELSAANSVNFGRIIFQIVYHFWSYFELVEQGKITLGDKITSIIPSGNSGNALGNFYAMQMGLPISKIILASNENNVLTDFVKTGSYDLRNRELFKTSSPAMDILKSSNIERLLYHLFGAVVTKDLMECFEKHKMFALSEDEHFILKKYFRAGYATEQEVKQSIKSTFEKYGYIIDPHTATAFVVASKRGNDGISIIASTAEWTKFQEAIGEALGCKSDFETLTATLGLELPKQIAELADLPDIHKTVIDIEDVQKEVLAFV